MKTMPKVESIARACAQDQASESVLLWLITSPSVKKLAVLMTTPAAKSNSLVFVTKLNTNLIVSSYQCSEAKVESRLLFWSFMALFLWYQTSTTPFRNESLFNPDSFYYIRNA